MALSQLAGRLWASTLGGPLLVVEERRLASWRGADHGDYERACTVSGLVGAINVGHGQGLVLGDEPAVTAVAIRSDGVVFVRWHAAEDALEVEHAIVDLEGGGEIEATDQGIELDWRGPFLVVHDAVVSGRDPLRFDVSTDPQPWNGALRVPFSTGRYAVRVGHLNRRVGNLSLVQLLLLGRPSDPPRQR